MATKKRTTITFQPTEEVRALMAEAVRLEGGEKRGARSRIINEAIRAAIASGKKGGKR